MGFFPLSGEATKGEKEIFPWITKGTLYFLHSWLSSHGKNKFPHSLLRSSWGNLLSPFLLSHSWGKYDVPFVIHGKIFFSPFVAPPLKGKKPIPIPPNYGIKPFIYYGWCFELIFKTSHSNDNQLCYLLEPVRRLAVKEEFGNFSLTFFHRAAGV